jgi:preprotein translocase subunit SecG
MENILLTLNIIFAIILILLILLQKSEGGALGIGVSQDSFMFSRTSGDFFTKATAIIATLFIICSLSLTIVGRKDLPTSTSVIDKVEEKEDDSLPKIPKNEN